MNYAQCESIPLTLYDLEILWLTTTTLISVLNVYTEAEAKCTFSVKMCNLRDWLSTSTQKIGFNRKQKLYFWLHVLTNIKKSFMFVAYRIRVTFLFRFSVFWLPLMFVSIFCSFLTSFWLRLLICFQICIQFLSCLPASQIPFSFDNYLKLRLIQESTLASMY